MRRDATPKWHLVVIRYCSKYSNSNNNLHCYILPFKASETSYCQRTDVGLNGTWPI